MEKLAKKIDELLPRVTRPGRYAGHEIHQIVKDWNRVDVRVALAFPDVYEIGMSHLGMAILYHVLNRDPAVLAERVYAPWTDFEALLRENGLPLFALESRRELKEFDCVGFSLQYELQYTNIINMLDLAGIPVWANQRTADHPLIIAGGPCALNPEPLAPFLDAVVLGDGEETALGLARVLAENKKKQGTRSELLHALAGLDGVYVPSLYGEERDDAGRFVRMAPQNEKTPQEVMAQAVQKLAPENYPVKPLVPLIEITHDRFSMEIMRGCTRGCRFCNAGMAYRPVRERPVSELLQQARQVIKNTGFDEISLVSLSTSDYSQLIPLMQELQHVFAHDGLTLSFPSLRPDTFTPETADLAMGLRRGGLTLAPEAGTQRLRDVINKNNTEDDLLRAVDLAFQRGWKTIKLYFMIGLPTETDEDLQGIVDLVGKVHETGRRYGKRDIHVSISPFSPKPHTPFQWEAQNSLDEFERKIDILKRGIRFKGVKLNWRDPMVSRLEAVLGRGDRSLARVIVRAWELGARFDAWTDHFSADRWTQAFQDEGLDLDEFVAARDSQAALPWDHLSKGVSKSFLLKERDRALTGQVTPDCREGCQVCGLEKHPVCRQQAKEKKTPAAQSTQHRDNRYGRSPRTTLFDDKITRIRLAYRRGQGVRFMSHLDTTRLFIRAFRRAGIRLAYSQGFHAHPKLSSGPPLSLGFFSDAEYLDAQILGNAPRNIDELLTRTLPDDMEVFASRVMYGKPESLNSVINLAAYTVTWEGDPSASDLQEAVQDFMRSNTCKIKRIRKGKEREINIRLLVKSMTLNDGMHLLLKLTREGSVRVDEVMRAIIPAHLPLPDAWRVTRTGLYVETGGRRLTPLEL